MADADHFPHEQVRACYVSHHQWLLGWLRRKVSNSFDAADLTHDTFVCLLGEKRTEPIREVRPFLVTVARRLLMRRRRREALETAYLETLAAMPMPTSASPESYAEAVETLLQLDQALDGLPSLVRCVFIMAHIEELTYHQIAQRLNISPSTVKKYLTRANAHCLFALPA